MEHSRQCDRLQDPRRRCQQKIKEHYVGASTLMQDRYHFWVQMAQADQTSISALETAVRTQADVRSVQMLFLFGFNESFSRFREDIYRDGQRKPKDPLFTLAFVVSQAVSFEAAQQTNKLLAHSPGSAILQTTGQKAHHLMPLPLGSHVYAKPRPSQRGSPWIYGQIIDSTTPRSYSINTGNFVLRCNRAQLHPARTRSQATSTPSADAALSTSNARTQTCTATASSTTSDRTNRHPTAHSTTATGTTDQRDSSSPC